jgi:glycyl-tRNA synthetase beta chain
MLKDVIFQKELGSYAWKTDENVRAASWLVATLEDRKFSSFKDESLFAAVRLAKTDLTTELVKEFTELQGVVGGLYARSQGHGATVAAAIYAQYTPASTEDAVPPTVEGQILGLADRIQTIVAMFGIGSAPTGSRDPFALRRAANAIVKILADSGLPLTLTDVLRASGSRTDAVASFLTERLSFYLKDVRGFAYDVVNAVLAAGADDVRDAIARAEALTAVRGSEDFIAISAAFKRIKNILRQAEDKQFEVLVDGRSFLGGEALALDLATTSLAPKVTELRTQRNYQDALAAIATLRPAVDAFFDKVMVLDSDQNVRGANLEVISNTLNSFSSIADFSEIVVN